MNSSRPAKPRGSDGADTRAPEQHPAHFSLGTSISAKKLVPVLEKREGLGKDLARVIDVRGKQNYAREEKLPLLCHFCC